MKSPVLCDQSDSICTVVIELGLHPVMLSRRKREDSQNQPQAFIGEGNSKKKNASNELAIFKEKVKRNRTVARDIKKGHRHLFQERQRQVRYEFIMGNNNLFPIEKMCKVSKISRCAYYNWFNGKSSKRAEKRIIRIML